jgi:hypothetical protein
LARVPGEGISGKLISQIKSRSYAATAIEPVADEDREETLFQIRKPLTAAPAPR